MPTIRFTDRTLKTLKPALDARIDYWDESLPGFGLRISESGVRTWVAYYRINGRKRRFKIESASRMGLADARDRAKDVFAQVAKGVDPAAERKQDRVAETFGELAALYLELHAKPNKRSWKEDERILNKEVLPLWGSSKAKAITRKDVLHLLDLTVKRGARVHANRVLALIRKVFNFGISRDIVNMNPCQAVSRPTEEHSRERVLSADEVRMLWVALAEEHAQIEALFKIYLLTAQRGAEVRSMAWSEIDLPSGWWTIPGAKTKNGLAHRVFLCEPARELILRLREDDPDSPWVFPSRQCLGQHVDNIQKAIQRIRANSGIDFVGHDLRRTAASHMTGMGIQRFVVSKILNHVEPGVTKVYDRHSYDQEKREALEKWANRVVEIVMDPRLEIGNRPNEQFESFAHG